MIRDLGCDKNRIPIPNERMYDEIDNTRDDNLAQIICITKNLNRNEHNIISYEVNDLKNRMHQE
jgi:hypothetical protein